jgi:hypothetical protein
MAFFSSQLTAFEGRQHYRNNTGDALLGISLCGSPAHRYQRRIEGLQRRRQVTCPQYLRFCLMVYEDGKQTNPCLSLHLPAELPLTVVTLDEGVGFARSP